MNNLKQTAADDAFEAYNFGDDASVVSVPSTWNDDDADDYTKVIYIQWADEEDSRKVSFHVSFEGDDVLDAYGYDVETGNEV